MIPNLGTFRLAIVGVLLAWSGIATWGWRHEVTAYAQFRAQVEQAGKSAHAAAQQENAKHEQVRKAIAAEWQARIGPAQDDAVRRYRAAHPVSVQQCPRSGGVPQAAAGAQTADGAAGQSVADPAVPDDAFIRACAHDALQVMTWQEWATRNGLPVQ